MVGHTNASHNMVSEERSRILIEEHRKGFRLRTRTLRVKSVNMSWSYNTPISLFFTV